MLVIDANSPKGFFEGVVCLLEDEPGIREEMGEFLSRSGYQVNLFSDGYDFLHWVRGNSPQSADCVICSWSLVPESSHLPPINAPAVLRMVEHYLQASPSIVLSDEDDVENIIDQAMLHGARGFVTKPFENSYLLERVNLLVRMRNNIERSNIWSSTVRMKKKNKIPRGISVKPRDKKGSLLVRLRTDEAEATPKPAIPKSEPVEIPAPPSVSTEVAGAGEKVDSALAWEIVPGAPPQDAGGMDEEIVQEYVVSFEDLVTVFEESVLGLEPLYEGGSLSDFSAAFDLAQTGYRALHTLKGNAGFLNADKSQGLIHCMEDVLGLVRSQPDGLTEDQVAQVVDLFLVGKDVLGGLCRYLQAYHCEKGYESTPAFELYENICLRVKNLEEELQMASTESSVPAGNFDDMF